MDILQIPGFLDPRAAAEMREHLRAAAGAPATVSAPEAARRVDAGIRQTTRVATTPAVRDAFSRRLEEWKPRLEEHFAVSLSSWEEPQFLRYQPGHFFVAHQDGNTPLVHDDTRFRRISAVLFLSSPAAEPAPDCYGGGELVFHGDLRREPMLRIPVAPPAGTLVAFRSETTHEVTPVTHGERFTVVTWLR